MASDLGEHLENRFQALARNTDAVVGDRDLDLVPAMLGLQRYSSSGRRVLCRVVEQVRKNLRKAHRVGTEKRRLGGCRYREHVPHLLDQRTVRFHGRVHDVPEVYPLG